MSLESGTLNKTTTSSLSTAWLWKLLFVLLLGPVLLFPDRFPSWAVFAALALLLLPWIVSVVQTRRLLPPAPINFLLLPLLLIFLPLSLWVSPLFWEASWPKTTSLLWSVAIFYAVVAAVPPQLPAVQRQSRLKILLLIYIAAGVAMTAVGLLAMSTVGALLPLSAANGLSSILGQSINPNEVGGIITLYLPLVVAIWAATWAYPAQRSPLRFALWLLLALLVGGALLLTASFGALLGVAVGCGLVLLLLNRRTRLLLLPITLLTLLGLIAVRLSPLFDQAVRLKWNSSILSRLTIWQQALHTTQDFPLLGTGLGTFRYLAPAMYPLGTLKSDVYHAHNLFWQAALDFGWLGGLLFALIWLFLLIYLLRSLRHIGPEESGRGLRIIAAGLLGSLAAHAVYSLFDALAPGARPAFALWYLFGLIVALGAGLVPPLVKAKRWRVAAAAALLLLTVTLAWYFWPVQISSSVTASVLLRQSPNSAGAVALAAQTARQNCRANWQLGLLEHSRADVAARDSAWQQLLGCSAEHTVLMQHLAPDDHALAESAIAQQPQDAAAYFWRASQEVATDPGAAIPYYEQGLAITPADGRIWVKLGQLREAAGDVQGALVAYDKGCFLVDAGKNGCPLAGRLYMAEGSYELAADRYRTSMKQLPGWPRAQRGLVDALLAMGRDQEAVPYLTKLADNGDSSAADQLQELLRGEP